MDNRKLEASLGRTASLSPSRQVSAVYGATLRTEKGIKQGDILRNLREKNKALAQVRPEPRPCALWVHGCAQPSMTALSAFGGGGGRVCKARCSY